MVTGGNPTEIILILPYLHVNTTSSTRFKSFIIAFQKYNNVKLKVVVVNYSNQKSYSGGMDLENTDPNETPNFELIDFKPNLNQIQKIGFQFLDSGNFKLWRVFQLLHLVLYRNDIFNIGTLNLKKPSLNFEYGFVITSGGHFSYFSTASVLAKQLNYKLILDYRDPWTFAYTPIDGLKLVHRLKKWVGREKEIQLLQQADLISIVSKSLKGSFPTQFQEKIVVIPNGSNYTEHEIIKTTPSDKFNIVYAGTIYNEQLIDDSFFEAFKQFIADKDQKIISLQFLGANHNKTLKNKLKKYQIQQICEVTKRLKKEEMLTYLNNASLFLHLKYGTKKEVITSKQADYLAFQRPILLPISDEGDLAESIINHHAGYVCKSKEEIVIVLEELWAKFIKGENLFIPQSKEFSKSISREFIANEFAERILKC